jgi:uncharacterized YigZ family protein
MPDHYFTIAEAGEGHYKEKGSKFISYAFPVADEEEIKERLSELRKQYFDARHICYAWMLGPDGDRFRAQDDGEPNHTAGDPILNQIRSFGLSNTLVAVVRYFGGIKLGASGLTTAYKLAAKEALEQVNKKEIRAYREITFTLQYEALSEIMRLIHDMEMILRSQQYLEQIEIKALYRPTHKAALESRLEYLPGLLKVEEGELIWKPAE